MLISVRKAGERGRTKLGWLESRHSFAFGGYVDGEHMGFRALRVINEDRVTGGGGFPTHPHRDMEILTYVVEGALEHEDSMGNVSVIPAGELQRMSAGTGVTHSEYNHSGQNPVHFLQIWILPDRDGLAPSYEQMKLPADREAGFLLVGSRDGRDGSLTIHQDVDLYSVLLEPGATLRHSPDAGRHVWVQQLSGRCSVNGERLVPGDGIALSEVADVEMTGEERTEMLLFDLA